MGVRHVPVFLAAPDIDPPVDDPPATRHRKFGLHINQFSSQLALVERMAKEGLLICAVAPNDYRLCNNLVKWGVKWVISRKPTPWDKTYEGIVRGPSDEAVGAADWNHPYIQEQHNALDNAVYIQPKNEGGIRGDAWWWLGFQRESHKHGRGVALYGDSPGNHGLYEVDGRSYSLLWQPRVDSGSLAEAIKGSIKDIVIYHGYGRFDFSDPDHPVPTSDPGSGIFYDEQGREVARDDKWWPLFGGAMEVVYRDIVPVNMQPMVVYGESGPSDAVYRGAASVIMDERGYDVRLAAQRWAVGRCRWSLGNGYGWALSNFDEAMPALYEDRVRIATR